MTNAAGSLLAHWTSARVERVALAYALRWDGTSELARQVDRAFEYYIAWLEEVTELFGRQATAGVTSDSAAVQGFDLLRSTLVGLLEELRSRVQFLQARAADIRISGKLEEVAAALLDLELDQVADALVGALQKPAGHDLAADLARIEQAHPELPLASQRDLKRLGKRVEQKALANGFNLREWLARGGLQTTRQFLESVAAGVAGNAAYAWILHVIGK